MEEIKLGDVVCLKSDPFVKMTVEGDSISQDCVICVWFHDLELRSDSFNKSSLTKVVEKQ